MTAPSDLRETLERVAEIRADAEHCNTHREECLHAAVDQLVALNVKMANMLEALVEYDQRSTSPFANAVNSEVRALLADARLVRELLSPERGR